jgi:putative sigma-54 modulation protein
MKATYQSVHFTADNKLIQFIDSKLEKLERIHQGILDASVILKLENTGKVKDKVSEIALNIPGNKIIASSTAKTFEQATDESISALTRQLKKVKGKRIDSGRVQKTA